MHLKHVFIWYVPLLLQCRNVLGVVLKAPKKISENKVFEGFDLEISKLHKFSVTVAKLISSYVLNWIRSYIFFSECVYIKFKKVPT